MPCRLDGHAGAWDCFRVANPWLICVSAGVAIVASVESAPQRPAFHTAAAAVAVDVVVRDRRGDPVVGLGQADFELYEDGTKQSITTFDAVDLPSPLATIRTAPSPDRPRSVDERRFHAAGNDWTDQAGHPLPNRRVRPGARRAPIPPLPHASHAGESGCSVPRLALAKRKSVAALRVPLFRSSRQRTLRMMHAPEPQFRHAGTFGIRK